MGSDELWLWDAEARCAHEEDEEDEEDEEHKESAPSSSSSLPWSALSAEESASLERYLAEGGDPNVRDAKGRTLLMVAASLGNVEAVRAVLRYGADLELRQQQGVTTLMFAAMAGNANIVHALLTAGANVLERDRRGLTAHDYASLKGNYFISCLLLQHSIRNTHPHSSSSNEGSRSSVAKEESLLSARPDLELTGSKENVSVEKLRAGSSEQHASASSMRIPQSANLSRAADLSTLSDGAPTGSLAREPDVPRLPAHMVEMVQKADKAAVCAYLDGGGDVNAVDDELSGTMLMCAASAGHTELTATLLEAKANVDIRDGNGCTALATACFSQQQDTVRLLLEANANVDNQDLLGLTALMVAALSGATSIIVLLLSAGATPSLRDRAGRTAYDYAQINGHTAARKMLRAHRLGRLTKEQRPARMTEAEEQKANAAMQQLLAEEAAKASADAQRAARKQSKSRKNRKERKHAVVVDTNSSHGTPDPDLDVSTDVGTNASLDGEFTRPPSSLLPIPLGGSPAAALAVCELELDAMPASTPSKGLATCKAACGEEMPMFHMLRDVRLQRSGAGGGSHGAALLGGDSVGSSTYGTFGQLWGGYDTTAHSSMEYATHDTSRSAWPSVTHTDADEDASVASLAASVACSALDEQSVGGEDTPSALICPLTGELMRDPVATVDGQVYDRQAIATWLETHDTSPLTGEVLPMKVLVPSLPLRAMLSEMNERRKLRKASSQAVARSRSQHAMRTWGMGSPRLTRP